MRIIQHMQPKASKQLAKKSNKGDTLACKFPGLAIPNEAIVSEVKDPISDVMAELEAFAPNNITKYGILLFFFLIVFYIYNNINVK